MKELLQPDAYEVSSRIESFQEFEVYIQVQATVILMSMKLFLE